MSADPEISVVVPVFNEEESLGPLHAEVCAALDGPAGVRGSWELVLVDDRSTDRSLQVMLALRERDQRVRIVRFRRNAGQTAAMAAGFDRARGRVVVTLDGDLQNDPADIPSMVKRLDEGYDIVAGWRRKRHDGFLLRRLPSLAANRLIALVTGTRIHDTGCTLKAFRRQVVKNLPIYAEQHRFLPAMSRSTGARVVEVTVNHRPRRFGRSKYGIGRAFRVFLDLFVIKMISQFAHRPLHYFGLFALPFGAFSLMCLALGSFDFEHFRMVAEWPQVAVLSTALFLLLALHFILLGLLAELVVTASGLHRRNVLDRILAEHKEGPR
jgi:glycosyltransferase involved in cell wall biosynthesis